MSSSGDQEFHLGLEPGQSDNSRRKGPDLDVTSVLSSRSHHSQDSGVSMSDRSKGNPPDMTEERKGPGSDVSSVLSSRSHHSRDSGVSMRSDRSKGNPPDMTEESVPCDVCSLPAVKECLTCMDSYCMAHVRDHYNTPEYDGHQLQDLHHHTQCLQQQSVAPPGEIQFVSVQPDSVLLRWSPPEGAPLCKFKVTWKGGQVHQSLTVACARLRVTELTPGEKYHFTVTTISQDGHKSTCVGASVHTVVPPPEELQVDLRSQTADVKWTKPAGVDEATYLLEIFRDQECIETIHRDSCHYTITDLQTPANYSINVTAVLENGRQSNAISKTFKKDLAPTDLLQELGLKTYYPGKLTLSSVLEIGKDSITDEPAKSHSALTRIFLKRLMMTNITARSVKLHISEDVYLYQSDGNRDGESDSDWGSEEDNESVSNDVNPLDIITALYLCSDPFLQQEIALKMSLCQFSVPFLLPNCDTKDITFILWSMRNIVKRFRPHSLTDANGFVEDRVVDLEMPLVSFVRLGESSLSKSHTLNMLLSNPQQYHDTFLHRNLKSCDASRIISNGLVEISWYLPCGTKSIDVFPEPLAVANLRGDISDFETQYRFLCQASAAVFVFADNFKINCNMLQDSETELFLVTNAQSSTFKYADLKHCAKELRLPKCNTIVKDKKNDADFIETLCSMVKKGLAKDKPTMTMNQMATLSSNFKILVDEQTEDCLNGKRNADKIKSQIQDIQQFKNKQLPSQGNLWKELSRIEKEECRLKEVGNQNISEYKGDLKLSQENIREQQRSCGMSMAMKCFISTLSSASLEKSYFLKWLQMDLDSLCSAKLSNLREQYKEKCLQIWENTEEIAEIDKKMSESSLGIEHLLRELSQLYESAVSNPVSSHEEMRSLPKHCAELLLEGFPVELVDGDASNIPMRWIKDVLTQLNDLVKPNNKMMVVTVLGVQSTGKSTLLNTMFGVQFAVSSGRCTRGAFMVLIRLRDDMKKELKCDFLLIIDTEGLKSPELATLQYSHEHDNELATLVVGLSDVTIVNMAMENSTEMKDVLQIVVHAFLRMDEVGKRPRCLFVHQNVADVSAHAKNMKDRKILLEHLNEMTEAACIMENKDDNKKFTDVMKYDPDKDNFYIPGLWHGSPPMAPVSSGYCEAVYELRKCMISALKERKASRNTIMDFIEWTESLWRAVKFEKFIFSFRNSLVAEAYRRVCIEYSKWEWKFRKDMHAWITTTETRISNFGKYKNTSQTSDINAFLTELKQAAQTELTKGEKSILDSIASYYEKSDCRVELIEQYRADFQNSATSLRKELHNSVSNRINAAASLREGMFRLEAIKKNHASVVEERVLKLLEDCRRNQSQKSELDLRSDFEKMWTETINVLSFEGLAKQDIMGSVYTQIWHNLEQKGSSISEHITKVNLNDCGLKPFTLNEEDSSLWLTRKWKEWCNRHTIKEAQEMADKIIEDCRQLVANYTSKEADYDDTYTSDILNNIDETIASHHPKHFKITEGLLIHLKLHVCANAAREFQKMHDCFVKKNDLRRCLEENKENYWKNFKDIFHDRDQSQRKADEFTSSCLKPAIKAYLDKYLGSDIIDVMMSSERAVAFNSRTSFQYSVLKNLFDEFNFKTYVSYISSYERFVKNWISEQISILCPEAVIYKLEEKRLTQIMNTITHAIYKAQEDTKTTSDIKDFINNICEHLKKHLTIPNSAFVSLLSLNNSKEEPFVMRLSVALKELQMELLKSLRKITVESKLNHVEVKPQDELFRKVIGCGHQCPFCKAPCEKGGSNHEQHFASIHRPQGIGGWYYENSGKLLSEICSSLVVSNAMFLNVEKDEYHPYKKYLDVFPDWHIQPDSSIEASDYWKYVMTKCNEKFAEEYNAEPADIPAAWNNIKKEDADQVLKELYNMN